MVFADTVQVLQKLVDNIIAVSALYGLDINATKASSANNR